MTRIGSNEDLRSALRFYAGLEPDAWWEGNQFMTVDKFGGYDAELTGPVVALEALGVEQVRREIASLPSWATRGEAQRGRSPIAYAHVGGLILAGVGLGIALTRAWFHI